MQNISNYSNISEQGRNTSYTIEHYQKYITEMTAYINQNNRKYTKNMNTLKEYYEEQIASLQDQKEELLAVSSSMENEKMTLKDMLANANMQITQLQERLEQAQRNVELGREKIERERKLIDSIYEDMNKLRNDCAKEVQQYNKRAILFSEENQRLKLELREKIATINSLNQKKENLQQNLRDRYLEPQKMRDVERESDKIKIMYEQSRKKCLSLQQREQNLNLQLSKYRKQNELLKIMKGNYTAQKQLQIQKVQKQQKEQAEYRINKLQNENQSLIYQINESQSKIKKMAGQMNVLETELQKKMEIIEEMQVKVNSHENHKDSYVSQFASLKNQYEGVIQRLEDSLIDYQKKNWNLQQQNNDLNSQLQSLQELLQEMKAMNSLNPLRKEYRKMAQLQLLSRQPTTNPKQQKSSIFKPQKQKSIDNYIKVEKSDFDDEWTRLLGDIQKIKV